MDCSHARLLLLFDRPGEIGDEADALRSHLQQCPACRAQAEQEKLADAAIGSALLHVPVPDGLAERIAKRLARQRRPGPWPWTIAAGVLLVLSGTFAAIYFRPMLSPPLDLARIYETHGPVSNPEIVEAWFHKQGVPMKMPAKFSGFDFGTQFLDSWDVVSWQGKRIAKLSFVNSGPARQENTIDVYVIPKKAFRLDSDIAEQTSKDNLLLETQGEFMYLISVRPRASRGPFH